MVLAICDRFHCLPSQAEDEDASVIRRLELERIAYGKQEGGDDW